MEPNGDARVIVPSDPLTVEVPGLVPALEIPFFATSYTSSHYVSYVMSATQTTQTPSPTTHCIVFEQPCGRVTAYEYPDALYQSYATQEKPGLDTWQRFTDYWPYGVSHCTHSRAGSWSQPRLTATVTQHLRSCNNQPVQGILPHSSLVNTMGEAFDRIGQLWQRPSNDFPLFARDAAGRLGAVPPAETAVDAEDDDDNA